MDHLKSRFLPVLPSKTANAVTLDPQCLKKLLADFPARSIPPVILCIGTDRIIGDCLGPLVGTMLCKSAGKNLSVYGTLHRTVHALNLHETILYIKKKHPDRVIIAVDASLGTYEHIGTVFVRPGCLRPGAGVCKDLPEIGDISITGIANSESSQPYLDLQTSRLATISAMADTICGCILDACLPQKIPESWNAFTAPPGLPARAVM